MLFRRGVKSYISKAALALQEGVLKCEKFVLCPVQALPCKRCRGRGRDRRVLKESASRSAVAEMQAQQPRRR